MLTTRDGKLLAFGYEAEQQYGEAMAGGSDSDDDDGDGHKLVDVMLFRHFKMLLHKHEVTVAQ